MKQLIVNADDYGPDQNVRGAILKGFDEGILSSTSVLVNFDDYEKYVQPLVERRLPCGIHLNIFSGNPCTASSFEECNTPEALKIEFQAQLKRLIDTGAWVTHIDNHRAEIYLRPDLLKVVVDLAKEFSLPMRVPFQSFPFGVVAQLGRKIGLSGIVLDEMCAAAHRYIQGQQVRHPDYFLAAFLLGEPTMEELETLFKDLPEGVSEICSHPSFEGRRGVHDLAMLRHFNRERLKSEFGIEVVNYSVL